VKILTSAEMQEVDRLSSERYGVPSLHLMEHAGQAVARFVLAEFGLRQRVLVLCGRGNNGGDGFVAARHLAEAGRQVTVLLLGSSEKLAADASVMFERFDGHVIELQSEEDLAQHDSLFREANLFLDSVLGTGFKPPLRGLALAVRDFLFDCLQASKAPVIAVDLPSGWDADSKEASVEGAFPANAVVSFTAPKLAHVFGNLTTHYSEPIVVAPIGSPEKAIVSKTGLLWTGSAKRIADEPRLADSNKGRFGHVLIVGGARGKSGAAAMASLAALRTGAGLVTAAVPSSILSTVAGITPELMTLALEEGLHGEIALSNLQPEQRSQLLERKTVLAVGPGISQSGEAPEFVREFLRLTDLPVVLDADGLNAVADHLDVLQKGTMRPVVLTPHPGEMARLMGTSVKAVQENREQIAKEFAVGHKVTLVLKGWRTLVAHPDGRIAVNTTGNPGMAKGGSGDILTGIIAAMLAQYPQTPAEAVDCAVYLHGLSADCALREQDEHTLLATDTVAHLFRAFRFQARDERGYVWIQGLPSVKKECL
jgi:ADP-dependent NAD(P)H-hydrate dehydratase / NAD(P)H-hydrate epimerase